MNLFGNRRTYRIFLKLGLPFGKSSLPPKVLVTKADDFYRALVCTILWKKNPVEPVLVFSRIPRLPPMVISLDFYTVQRTWQQLMIAARGAEKTPLW